MNFIFEGANDLISLLNNKFEFLWINESTFKRMLGYEKDDLIGKNSLDLMHPDDVITSKQFRNVLENKGKLELRFRRKDGTYKWFEVRGYYFKSQDSTYKMFILSKDISDRREIKKKLIQSEVKYRQLFEYIPFIVLILDKNGIIMDINRKLLDYGYSREEILGESFQELIDKIPKEYITLLNRKFVELKEKSEIEPIDIQLINSEKNLIWFTIYAHNVKIEQETFIQVIMLDINDRKLAEQKLKESEKKYRTIVESVIESYFELDKYGNYTYINNVLCRNLGYSHKEDILNKNYREFYDEKTSEYFYKKFSELWKSEEIHMSFEGTWIREDGQKIAFKGIAGLRYNIQGEKEGFYGIARNI
ncbi:MAG: PAS domain S-box protein [Promethearchaeota archaeon]